MRIINFDVFIVNKCDTNISLMFLFNQNFEGQQICNNVYDLSYQIEGPWPVLVKPLFVIIDEITLELKRMSTRVW